MLRCCQCGAVFDEPQRIYETHGLDTPPYETLYVCPSCKDTEICKAVQCESCGKYLVSDGIHTKDGLYYCDQCYTHYDPWEDDL